MSTTAAGALLASLGTMLFAGSVEMSRVPQLVAFVPEHSRQAMTPARQAQLDALLAREAAEAKPQLPANYRAVAAKAVLPEQHHTRRHTAITPASQVHPSTEAIGTSAQQIAKSDQLGDRVVPTEPQPQQQWIVVTEWRAVNSTSRIPQTISDFEAEGQATTAPATTASSQPPASQAASASAPAQSPGKNQPAAAAHHFTVTQLILRVVPANPNSTSTQPPTATVRDGWFVIQL